MVEGVGDVLLSLPQEASRQARRSGGTEYDERLIGHLAMKAVSEKARLE
jgi:hypothetical protein